MYTHYDIFINTPASKLLNDNITNRILDHLIPYDYDSKNQITIGLTGVRQQENIISTGNLANNGSSLIIYKDSRDHLIFPPRVRFLEEFESTGRSYKELNVYEFFKHKKTADIRKYLWDHAVSEEIFMEDFNLDVSIKSLEGNIFESIPTEKIESFYYGGMYKISISEIFEAIPRKHGSKARRHTLVFRPSIWTLKINNIPDIPNYIVDLKDSNVYMDPMIDIDLSNRVRYDLALDDKLLVVYSETGDDVSHINDDMESLIYDIYDIDVDNIDLTKKYINMLTPGALKSAIQKIIRTGAQKVFLNEYEHVDGDAFLIVCFIVLYNHPGSFVPDIQKFVRGIESALKRLAITIIEDSYSDDTAALIGLLVSTRLLQEYPYWYPSQHLIIYWIGLALKSKHDERVFEYDLNISPDNEDTDKDENIYYLGYLLLNKIKSFPSDINMLYTWDGSIRPTKYKVKLFDSIPLEHIVDQHTYTEIAYIFNAEYMDQYNCINTYKPLFNDLFRYVTGLNHRRHDRGISKNYYLNYEREPFVKLARKAQRFILEAKRATDIRINDTLDRNIIKNNEYISSYELKDEWLSGMLGVIEIYYKRTGFYVTLDVTDIYDMCVIYRPTRGLKKSKVTKQERNEVINIFIKKLENGIVMKSVPNSMLWFKNSKLYIRKNTYYLELLDGSMVRWDDIKRNTRKFNIHPKVDHTLENSIYLNGSQIEKDAGNTLDEMLEQYDESILQRLHIYIANSKSKIQLNKISKTGEGQELPVNTLDGYVYKILSDFTLIYPAAIQRSKTSPTKVFDIIYGPLFWQIKDKLVQKLFSTTYDKQVSLPWIKNLNKDNDHRKLYDYQQKTIDKLINTTKRGSLIYGSTGIGKTVMVLRYILHRIHSNNMPKYCVYTLPPSAIKTISKEFEYVGIPYNILSITKNIVNKLPTDADGNKEFLQPYKVNIIKHDHMKNYDLPDFLMRISNSLMLVVDEFHKAMTNSQRTGVIVDIMRVCNNFVGMSATVIRDQNIDRIITWLEQIVDFEVNAYNFWVAANAMISLRIKVPVVTHRYEIDVLFQDEEKQLYDKLMLGNVDPQDFSQAVKLCYAASERQMLKHIYAIFTNIDGDNLPDQPNVRGVFCIVRNLNVAKSFQQYIIDDDILVSKQIHIITTNNPINLTPDMDSPIKLVLTTPENSEGYNLTKMNVVLQSVYFTNSSVREQLDGRTVRLGQDLDVYIYTFYIGILKQIWEKYQTVGSMSLALKGYAEIVGVSSSQLANI